MDGRVCGISAILDVDSRDMRSKMKLQKRDGESVIKKRLENRRAQGLVSIRDKMPKP